MYDVTLIYPQMAAIAASANARTDRVKWKIILFFTPSDLDPRPQELILGYAYRTTKDHN
jgi:hypothetical protein